MNPELPDVAFFHALADAADRQTLPRFRTQDELNIGTKPKEGFRFDPVTGADREAERVIRDLITARYPDHSIMGEEFGTTGSGPIQWILGPSMAPRPFLCGIPVWGTLIRPVAQRARNDGNDEPAIRKRTLLGRRKERMAQRTARRTPSFSEKTSGSTRQSCTPHRPNRSKDIRGFISADWWNAC